MCSAAVAVIRICGHRQHRRTPGVADGRTHSLRELSGTVGKAELGWGGKAGGCHFISPLKQPRCVFYSSSSHQNLLTPPAQTHSRWRVRRQQGRRRPSAPVGAKNFASNHQICVVDSVHRYGSTRTDPYIDPVQNNIAVHPPQPPPAVRGCDVSTTEGGPSAPGGCK